ncbi:MAG: DUF3450 family protein [Planctomycetaceae bacterium]|nr:DUF3450 family protein [Planctomycetaceae bacterium]
MNHTNSKTRRMRLACGGIGALALAAAAGAAAQQGPEGLDEARGALERWVETRKVITQEERDWTLGKELLTDRIALVQREIDGLKGRIGEAQGSIQEADRKRDELVAQNEKLKEASGKLAALVASLEARTLALLARSPEPIAERVKPLSQRLPKAGETTKASLSERFQNVVGILNELNKFQREVTVTSEVRQLTDGTSAEVTVLYIGVSCAFYASADGRAAGLGNSTATGWEWQPANERAADILKAIAVFRNESVAEFVQLPLRVQ